LDNKNQFNQTSVIIKHIQSTVSKEDGSDEFLNMFENFLKKYGCRALGEIDIYNERYHENALFVFSIIMANINNPKNPFQENKRKGDQALLDILEEQKRVDKWKWWNILSFGILGHVKY